MASWANPDEGLCPQCGHLNSRQWKLCDKCGERLPWAPPDEPKKGLNDLSDEQLATLFKTDARKDSGGGLLHDRRSLLLIAFVVLTVLSSVVEWVLRALHVF